MTSNEIREKVGYDPEELFRRSQEAYRTAYRRGETPSWSRHPLPDKTVEFIRELKKVIETPRVLDIGCGDGNKSEKLVEQGLVVVGVDHESEAIERAKRRIETLSVSSRLSFLVGDARKLDELFPEDEFDGIFDYQCLASIPPEFWGAVVKSYNHVLRPGGYILIDLLNLEGREFHGDISDKMRQSHEYVFEYDPNNPSHNGLEWENGLYVYFFDENETQSVFGENFELRVLEKRFHPYNDKRILWSALMRSKKQ